MVGGDLVRLAPGGRAGSGKRGRPWCAGNLSALCRGVLWLRRLWAAMVAPCEEKSGGRDALPTGLLRGGLFALIG